MVSLNSLVIALVTLWVSAVCVAGQSIRGSTVEDGGTETLGTRVNSVQTGSGREVATVERPASMIVPASMTVTPLLQGVLQTRSIDLRWISRTQDRDSAPDRRWGRFIVPVSAEAVSVDLSSATYLMLKTRPTDDASKTTRLLVSLRDASARTGPRLRIDARNLESFSPDRATSVAIAIPDLGEGIDLAEVRAIVFEPDGAHPSNVVVGWFLDALAVTSEPTMAGLHVKGAVDLGEKVAVTWEARADTDSVRVAVGERVLAVVPASEGQAILDQASIGPDRQLTLTPIAGEAIGATQRVALEPAQQASLCDLTFVGQRRDQPISRYLLGTNGQEPETAPGQGVQVVRWGGNQTSTYNWLEDVWNSANDWYHLTGSRGQKPWERVEDSRWYGFIEPLLAAGVDVSLHIPISDWVARRPDEGAPRGSYPRELYPEQQRWTADGKYGNGRTPDGKYIRLKDKSLTFRPNTVDFQRGWIEKIVETFGPADKGGVKFYGLDNEVNLWHSSHFGALWEGLDGPELVWRNIAYARMIKEVDPTAQVLGFGGWGQMGSADSDRDYRKGRWSHLPPEFSGLERKELRRGQDLLSWYLDQMRIASEAEGVRLIDIVSINWYPFLSGLDPRTGKTFSLVDEKFGKDQPYDPVVTPMQFDALRYWWDPTYVNEHNWTYQGTNKERLWDPYVPVVPKLKAIVAKHYPGTKLAITEYALGSEETMTGALLQVESLGIFADQDLWSAQRWFGTRAETWAYWGYALVGNWDGERAGIHGHFQKAATDNPNVTAWSTINPALGRRHVVLVNRSYDEPVQVRVPAGSATSFRVSYLTEPTGKQVVRLPSMSVNGDSVSITLPRFSAAVVVMEDQ